jgi:hypothetical protein
MKHNDLTNKILNIKKIVIKERYKQPLNNLNGFTY